MDHARKMALVDPRLLDTLRSQPPPPPTDTVGKIVQALDDEMKTILDRKDLDDGTKVTLYNQVLQRYNGLVDKRVKEPIRMIAVNESTEGLKARVEEKAEEDAPIRRLEATVLDTVPKSLQAKARRLMEHLKRNVAWSDRGELVHEGVPIAGSNAVDLVHDLLRKRKTNAPTGWRSIAKQLRAVNIPMELIGNVARRTYIQTDSLSRRSATTPRDVGSARKSLRWTPLARPRHPTSTPPRWVDL